MRIVILSSSPYSETGCAMAVRMAELGYVPVGALALPTLDRGTLLRKVGQWGVQGVVSYARAKLVPHRKSRLPGVSNPCLATLLKHGGGVFRSMREVAAFYDFPLAICNNQNAQDSIERLREWTPDLIIFTGGNILRRPVLDVPRLGVLNVHLGLLPEIRGMSSPEWSLLKQVPVGITIHYMDAGIDTGPVLQRYEFSKAALCDSLSDLRHQLIALGVEKMAEVVTALDRGAISAIAQSDLDRDNQFFVMHEWLQAQAAERLTKNRQSAMSEFND